MSFHSEYHSFINLSLSSQLISHRYPGWRWRSAALGWYLRSTLAPFSLTMYFAPGYCESPRFTSSCSLKHPYNYINKNKTKTNLSMLNGVTISGKVRFWAIVLGTPTVSRGRFGSGVITYNNTPFIYTWQTILNIVQLTVLAEKSTRFPIKFPLILPSFPFNRCFTDLSGRPPFWVACNEPHQYNSSFDYPLCSINNVQHKKYRGNSGDAVVDECRNVILEKFHVVSNDVCCSSIRLISEKDGIRK